MKDCIFCKIIKEQENAKIVYKDKYTIAFLPLELNTKAHLIIAPIKHYQNIFDIEANILCHIMQTAQVLAKHIQNKLNAKGINLLHASGKTAQQSVNHFHIHLMPRFKDDSLNMWPNVDIWQGDIEELYKIIKLT